MTNVVVWTSSLKAWLLKNIQRTTDVNLKRVLEKPKDLIKEAPVLKYYDNKHKSNLFMDASQKSIGTILFQ